MFKAIKTMINTITALVMMTNDEALELQRKSEAADGRFRLIYLDGEAVVIDLKTDTLLPI